jgi:hypothetical protein
VLGRRGPCGGCIGVADETSAVPHQLCRNILESKFTRGSGAGIGAWKAWNRAFQGPIPGSDQACAFSTATNSSQSKRLEVHRKRRSAAAAAETPASGRGHGTKPSRSPCRMQSQTLVSTCSIALPQIQAQKLEPGANRLLASLHNSILLTHG